MNSNHATSSRAGRLALSVRSGPQSLPALHRHMPLSSMQAAIGEHRYVLATNDEGQIVGVVPRHRILERLHSANEQERMRWELMPFGALVNVEMCTCPPEHGASFEENLDCIVITENESLVAISVKDDVFLSWQRLEPMLSAAACDPLTGLMNRLGYERRLTEEWARARRTGTSIGIVVVDLDKFKAINDHFGHQAGDDVLRSVASILETTLRSYDIVARYGGDEFLALCLDCQPGEIEIPIQRIQQEFARKKFEFSDVALPVFASIGAAVRHDGFDEFTASELFAAADECLYQSKAPSGEARVVEFGKGLPETATTSNSGALLVGEPLPETDVVSDIV